MRFKRIKSEVAAKGGKVNRDEAMRRRAERLKGQLSEPLPDNPAPLTPQFSAEDAARKQRLIPNEQVFKNPIKQSQRKPPGLIEKPKLGV